MRHIILTILIVTSFNCFGQDKYWEQLTQNEKNEILVNADIPPFAIAFYNGNYDLGQDSLVIDFLEKVSLNKSKELEPFYYFLFIKMCKKADGYIGEVMGECSINILLNHSNFVFNHMRQEMNKGKNEEYTFFKDNMIFEYYASSLERTYPNRPSFENFEKALKETTSSENQELKTKLLKEVKLGAEKMIYEDRNEADKLKQLEWKK